MKYLGFTIRILPVVLCIATPISILITYCMAVYLNHVTPIWPYISDTGTIPPESCLFGLFLNTVSFLFIIIVYLRHKQVTGYTRIRSSTSIKPWANRAASVFGCISCMGLNFVANFQEKNLFIAHILGAFMCFASGTIFFIFQTVFTYKMHPTEKFILSVRIACTSLNIISIISTFAPVRKALSEFKGDEKLFWTAKDGGFEYHLTSTISEWILVFSFCAYIGSVYWDFKDLKIEPLRIRFAKLNASAETQTEEVLPKTPSRSFWI